MRRLSKKPNKRLSSSWAVAERVKPERARTKSFLEVFIIIISKLGGAVFSPDPGFRQVRQFCKPVKFLRWDG